MFFTIVKLKTSLVAFCPFALCLVTAFHPGFCSPYWGEHGKRTQRRVFISNPGGKTCELGL